MREKAKYRISGAIAGTVSGLFGGGGGIPLVLLLSKWCGLEEKKAFATSLAVIFPACAVSAAVCALSSGLNLSEALPYLLGGLAGGFAGGKLYGNVPVCWLRRLFALFLLYGGVRYLR